MTTAGNYQTTRRAFLRLAGLGSAAMAAGAVRLHAAEAPAAKDRPNVLWLIAEDCCPDMACYGGQLVRTPNIDRLASRGMRFDNAFVTCPVCSPARSAFMTGMYQTSIGAHQHRTARDCRKPLPEGVQTVMDRFREAGYFVTNAAWPGGKKAAAAPARLTRLGKTDWNFLYPGQPFDGADWAQRKPGQPFFAQINFSQTHRTFQRDPDRPIDPDKVKVPPYYPDTPLARRDWADYLETIQILDGHVGEAIKRLEEEGLADSTIVMFVGDNGRPHVRGKQWLYEGGIRVPMIVRWPGHVQAGAVNADLVSSIDWSATLMNLAGLAIPKVMQGIPVLGPGAKNREFIVAARDRCDGTSDRIRCIRTKRWKYIRNFHPDWPYTQFNAYKKLQYPEQTELAVLKAEGKLTDAQKLFEAARRPPEELYDLQADPDEVKDLAADPACKAVLEGLRAKLDAWIKDTGDQGETPEPAEEVDRQREAMRKDWQTSIQRRGLKPDISDADYLAWWKEKMLGK